MRAFLINVEERDHCFAEKNAGAGPFRPNILHAKRDQQDNRRNNRSMNEDP